MNVNVSGERIVTRRERLGYQMVEPDNEFLWK
jgi:hypothetical protein